MGPRMWFFLYWQLGPLLDDREEGMPWADTRSEALFVWSVVENNEVLYEVLSRI